MFSTGMNDRRVTICLCSSRSIINSKKVSHISEKLCKAGYTISLEADLCEKALSSVEEMEKIASSTVIACYPRAVLSLFNSLGFTPAWVIDIRNREADEILESFDISIVSAASDYAEHAESSDKSSAAMTPDVLNTTAPKVGSDAWYPVIDRERCDNCGKCHDFCLFGVYAREDKKNVVKNPRNCKNNCPSCARICPQKAIIFPKYEKSPVNGGLTDEEYALSIDAKALYSDALRMKLMERKAGISLLKKK